MMEQNDYKRKRLYFELVSLEVLIKSALLRTKYKEGFEYIMLKGVEKLKIYDHTIDVLQWNQKNKLFDIPLIEHCLKECGLCNDLEFTYKESCKLITNFDSGTPNWRETLVDYIINGIKNDNVAKVLRIIQMDLSFQINNGNGNTYADLIINLAKEMKEQRENFEFTVHPKKYTITMKDPLYQLFNPIISDLGKYPKKSVGINLEHKNMIYVQEIARRMTRSIDCDKYGFLPVICCVSLHFTYNIDNNEFFCIDGQYHIFTDHPKSSLFKRCINAVSLILDNPHFDYADIDRFMKTSIVNTH